LQGGELLVNVRGTLGGVAVVPEHLAGYNISREVAMVPILSNIPVTWTAYWVASVTAQTWLTNVSKGVAYTGINLEDLRQLPVPIPPVAEIKVAVETIEKLYFISSQIEQQYNEAKAHLDKLDQSILAKAFRGELVPQDPNDEPASVLLERIRAERENLDTKKKAKGKTEKKSRKAKPEAAEPKQLSLPGFE
jgi:type I restriction enzyme S subunit